MKALILVCLLFFQGVDTSISSTTLNFDIVRHKRVVGKLKSTALAKDDVILYRSDTYIRTWLLKRILVNYSCDVKFSNELLESADLIIDVNKRIHASTHTRWKNNHYQIEEKDESLKTLEGPITFTSIQLYFREPIDIKWCYSEQAGSFHRIIPLGNHSYKKIDTKGNENLYYYKNGKLSHATIDGGLIRFKMVAND